MIKFDIITIFPEMFQSYIGESLIARAIKKKFIKINTHNPRKWTKDNHQTIDGRPFGGGLGMVMLLEPIYKAVNFIVRHNKNKKLKTKIIFFTPRGIQFTQKIATKLAKLDQIIFICGRYEGVDERVAEKLADIKLSIGEYDLMGGELAAMVCIEAISRLVPGVIGKDELLKERVTKDGGFIEYAQYTRPEVFITKENKKWRVPKVLTTGDHEKINEWRSKHCKIIK